ncbi:MULTISPECIES: SE1832 family protein [Staphylococcus]|uniref:SE1832 family protein n=1 Tax=Staphylococcus TaxID=1279 RepID=UPI000CD09601|nr:MULTISPECIES: SE1832 family protein [Staphylococcus]MBY7663492.1 hypothetical protein [Staphylococcus agnetis]MCO4326060.1 hypothetical protein [Staphylococcus agnetis]MCO4356896.1 hypothetical protein [Staphylococcus agnetis]MCO4362386.1 hypothetical protein [Staphylococcus agnetis]MCO4369303.1 hypothetical protein [Staphylococcus agnetis]
MNLEAQLQELKLDYVRLQGDLEKRESMGQHIDPLIKQMESIEHKISEVRLKMEQDCFPQSHQSSHQ